MTDDRYDPELLQNGDKRNVIDAFKNMTVEAIKEELDKTRHPIHVAIENYQHDFNIGTIVRNANAFNIEMVHIIGRRHWNRRGAMVTDRYMHITHHETTQDFLVSIAGMPLIAVDNVKGSVPLAAVRFPEKAVFVFGGEGPGLSQEMIRHASQIVAIEQYGSTRSVNVGVASGIVLYRWVQEHKL